MVPSLLDLLPPSSLHIQSQSSTHPARSPSGWDPGFSPRLSTLDCFFSFLLLVMLLLLPFFISPLPIVCLLLETWTSLFLFLALFSPSSLVSFSQKFTKLQKQYNLKHSKHSPGRLSDAPWPRPLHMLYNVPSLHGNFYNSTPPCHALNSFQLNTWLLGEDTMPMVCLKSSL